MAHFAQVIDGIVQQVIVAEQEFIDTLPDPNNWMQTSYNTRGGVHYNPDTDEPSTDQSKALRKNYAGIGYTYDPIRDAFIPEKPYGSWVLNEDTCCWEPPVPFPNDGQMYDWDETTVSWVLTQT
jgi:hypothetical protein